MTTPHTPPVPVATRPATGYPLAPSPAPVSLSGPAASTLAALADRIRAEERHVLDVATASLRIDSAGRLLAGGAAYPLEEEGMRALLMHYTRAFPRLTPAALLMRPATFGAVLRGGLADYARELPPDVRLRIRRCADGTSPERGTRAVYGATPTLAPPYDVDAVALDLGDACPPCATVEASYHAPDSRLCVHVTLPGAWLRADVTDGYPCRVSVTCGYGTRDLGDPAPDVAIRRRSRADLARPADGLYLDLFRSKLAAVPAWIRAKGTP